MPDDKKRETFREISVAGLLNEMARDRAVRKMPLPEKPEPTAKTLQAMLVGMGK
jgi:hypothetical protein